MRGNDPANSCYIATWQGDDVENNFVINFQFAPQQISDSKQAVFSDTIITGRSTPVKSYSHSAPRMISFVMEFFANPDFSHTLSTKEIKERVDQLRSLQYPDYKSKFVIQAPPRCLVRIGAQFAFLGICRNVSITYPGTSPWDIGQQTLAHHVLVNLTFEEVLNIPLDISDIQQGVNFREEESTTGIIDARPPMGRSYMDVFSFRNPAIANTGASGGGDGILTSLNAGINGVNGVLNTVNGVITTVQTVIGQGQAFLSGVNGYISALNSTTTAINNITNTQIFPQIPNINEPSVPYVPTFPQVPTLPTTLK